MSVRTDNANLIITIDAKESVEYQKAVQRSQELVRNIKKMEVGTDEYNAALKEQAEISKKLGATDYTKLSLKNLTDRKRALQEQIRILPQATAAELGLERELQRVNTALGENARRVRATNSEMQKATPAADTFGASFKRGLAFFAPLGIIQGIRQIGGALFGLAKDSVQAFDGAAKAEAQLEAAIKSTGGAAGKSVEELVAQSAELQKLTLYSDDQIQEAQGLLLTFTKVGGEIYDRSIPAITDMAAAMKTDLSTASIQVGKALNDPIKGVGALSKAGVQFTAEQKATIKTLVETGDVAGAQTLILKELETQFNGSAKAAADAGLGPLQKFQNRIGDIQEGIGLLITNGLGFLGPVLDTVATFAEKFVGVLVTGKKATGELSAGVNFLVGVLKLVYNAISGLVTAFTFLWDIQTQLFDSLKELPIIGGIVKTFANTFNFLIDAVTNTSAVFAGLKAAIQQTFDNASNYIKKTLLDIQIFAKEADLLLSFKDATKQRIKGELQALELERAQYAKAGKTVGQAYTDAYNDVINKEIKAAKVVNSLTNIGASGGSGGNSGSAGSGKTKKATDKKGKDTKGVEDFNIYDPAIAQAALDYRLKQLDEAAKREQSVLEESYLQGKLTQEQYELEKLRITQASYATQIELLDAFGQTEGDKRRELNIKRLDTEQAIMDERAAQIADMENLALGEVEQKFLDRLISEEEYGLSRLRVQLNFYDEQIRLLEEAGLTETEVYRKIQEDKAKAQADYNGQRIENEKRTAAIQEQIQRDGLEAASDIFSLGADLLGQDEKARKKHATAIKAFESASVIINALSEISAIHKKYAAIPGGTFIAIAQSIATGIRAGIAVGKINAQQFKYGGSLKDGGTFQGPSHEFGGVKFGIGGQIAEAEGGETIINRRSSELFGPLLNSINTYKGYGRPLFETGGIVRLPNTVPTGLSSSTLSRAATDQAVIQSDPRIDSLIGAMMSLTNALPMALSNVKAKVVYSELESAGDTINEIKRIASF